MLIQLHYETEEVKNEMEARAREEKIKKERDIISYQINQYAANIDDDDDYLCRFASRAPLTSIHRRSHTHPYDPGR